MGRASKWRQGLSNAAHMGKAVPPPMKTVSDARGESSEQDSGSLARNLSLQGLWMWSCPAGQKPPGALLQVRWPGQA